MKINPDRMTREQVDKLTVSTGLWMSFVCSLSTDSKAASVAAIKTFPMVEKAGGDVMSRAFWRKYLADFSRHAIAVLEGNADG